MGYAGVTIRTMPDSPTVNLEEIKGRIKELIEKEEGKIIDQKEEPVAFGLKAIVTKFKWDETKDSDKFNEKISKIKNINSSQVVDVRRMVQ
jgi:translation elongation factor aEF-1 beta